jgi:hypothetical protein
MRFDFVRVMTPGPLLPGAVPLVHWQAWPLDPEAVDLGLWAVGPSSLCRRVGMVLAYRDAMQCEDCAIRACLMTNAAEVFDRIRARQMAGRYERSTT